MDRIKRFYNSYPEMEQKRLERDPYSTIESLITKRHVKEFLREGDVVADIGCGPGHYSIWFMENGHSTLMVDMSQGVLELAQREVESRGLTDRLLGAKLLSATALDGVESDTFDITLLFGPLYHLLEREDRVAALREARRITKPNGLIFAATINRLCPIRDFLFRFTEQSVGKMANEYPRILKLVEMGIYHNHKEDPKAFTDAYFAPVEEIPALFEEENIDLVRVFSCEGMAAFLDGRAELIKKDTKAWDNFIDLVFRTSTEPSIIGSGEHTVFVGRKKT